MSESNLEQTSEVSLYKCSQCGKKMQSYYMAILLNSKEGTLKLCPDCVSMIFESLFATAFRMSEIEAENARLREALAEIRNAARSAVPLDGMSTNEQFAVRLALFARLATEALEGGGTGYGLEVDQEE